MLLGFKTKLKLNNQQRTQMAKHAGVARHAWNWGLGLTKQILDHNQNNPEEKIKFPSAIDLHKWLVALVKPQCPWYYESSKCAPQFALRQLRDSWGRAFRKTSQSPRFKRKGRNDSFTLDGTIKVVDHFQIQVPKIGVIKTYERLPLGYKPKSVTISRKADEWFISFKIEVEPKPTHKTVETVGVDLGVKTLAYLSTGVSFEGAQAYKRYEKRLSRLQWLNRNKVIGSKNWKKAQLKIAKLHTKIANIRQDTLHKITTHIAKNHSKIVIEDLNVSGMLKNGKLAKAIADMGFYEFRRQLEYKCQLYGSELIVADRWFPSSKTCSLCGWYNPDLKLSDRWFLCAECGSFLERDGNAAINLSRWSHHRTQACGQVAADSLG
ncbi:MAG: transposase [Xenococcaceae cyanobacterium MO_207.B15]|nr:transposase [Xenococcaceae cyanobacterium MO_207.B15]